MVSSAQRPVLAVASGGGHWVQLLRVRPALAGQRVVFVTVDPAYEADLDGEEFHVVPDATRWDKLKMIWLIVRLTALLVRLRPRVILTTGAAPGYLALAIGRRLGARTVWLDSIANVDELSLSGRKAGRVADLWLTQWPELARPEGPHYRGAVL